LHLFFKDSRELDASDVEATLEPQHSRRQVAEAIGNIRGHCGLQLVSAIDAKNEQFFADSCDKLLVRVADELVPVGDPALEGSKLDWAGPKRERANAVGVDVVGAIDFVGSFHAKATGKSSITRDR
jgi:hypothetical protein